MTWLLSWAFFFAICLAAVTGFAGAWRAGRPPVPARDHDCRCRYEIRDGWPVLIPCEACEREHADWKQWEAQMAAEEEAS